MKIKSFCVKEKGFGSPAQNIAFFPLLALLIKYTFIYFVICINNFCFVDLYESSSSKFPSMIVKSVSHETFYTHKYNKKYLTRGNYSLLEIELAELISTAGTKARMFAVSAR